MEKWLRHGEDVLVLRAAQGSPGVGLLWLSLKITHFEQDVTASQDAVGYRPCSAQLRSEDFSL